LTLVATHGSELDFRGARYSGASPLPAGRRVSLGCMAAAARDGRLVSERCTRMAWRPSDGARPGAGPGGFTGRALERGLPARGTAAGRGQAVAGGARRSGG